ncbi:hypothetical protein BAU01nite_29020 [Brevibacterium aurantiacum]|nr:hypothetical protein BAU01nite_29020 [Brevibacterium aurantiacum]
MASGCPSLICPFLGDQAFWANRVHDLGAGPRLLSRADITAHTLAERITDLVETETYRRNAVHLAEEITAENGTDRAVEILERLT